MKVTSVLLVSLNQSGCFLIRPAEEHLILITRWCCVHLINLVNPLPDSELCATAVLGGETIISKTKSTC